MRRKKDIILYLDAEEVEIILISLEAKEKEIKTRYNKIQYMPFEYRAIKEKIPKIKRNLKNKLLKWIGATENETN